MNGNEIIFIVEEALEGGYIAHCLGHSVFTEGETLEELRENIREAVECHFEPEIGTFHAILKDVADHLKITKSDLINKLF